MTFNLPEDSFLAIGWHGKKDSHKINLCTDLLSGHVWGLIFYIFTISQESMSRLPLILSRSTGACISLWMGRGLPCLVINEHSYKIWVGFVIDIMFDFYEDSHHWTHILLGQMLTNEDSPSDPPWSRESTCVSPYFVLRMKGGLTVSTSTHHWVFTIFTIITKHAPTF